MKRIAGVGSAFACCFCVWACALAQTGGGSSLPAAPPSPPVAPASPAPMDPEVRERLRKQLFSLTPYTSHDNLLLPGRLPVDDALVHLTTLRENTEAAGFDADPTLQQISRRVYGYLVNWSNKVLPDYRGDLETLTPRFVVNTNDPLTAMAILLMDAELSRLNKPYAAWRVNYDQICSTEYKNLMPLLRKAANGGKHGDRSVNVRVTFDKDNRVFLYAENLSGRMLHNATLHVKMSTLDDRDSRDHYYFLPEWKPGNNKEDNLLRIISGWRPAEAVTSVIVTLYSDEVIAESVRCPVDDNIPTSAMLLLPELDALSQRSAHLADTIKRIEAVSEKLGGHADYKEQAMTILKGARLRFDTLLESKERALKALENQLIKERGKKKPDYDSRKVQKIQQQIALAKSELADIRGGKK